MISYERREDHLEHARRNVETFFGAASGQLGAAAGRPGRAPGRRGGRPGHPGHAGAVGRRWPTVAAALRPGGVLLGYVATTTQLSRLVEALRDAGVLDRAARLGVPGAQLARAGPGGPAGSPDAGAHRVPGHRPPAGARGGRADPAAPAGQDGRAGRGVRRRRSRAASRRPATGRRASPADSCPDAAVAGRDGSGVRAGHRAPSAARATWMQLPGHSLAESITSSRRPAGTAHPVAGRLLQVAGRRP